MTDLMILVTTTAVFIGASVDDFLLLIALFGSHSRNPIKVAAAKLTLSFLFLLLAATLGQSLLKECPVPSIMAGFVLLILGVSKLFSRRNSDLAETPNSIWAPIFVTGLDNCIGYAVLFANFTAAQTLVASSAIISLTAAMSLSALLASKLFSASRFKRFDWAALLLVGIGIYDIVK